MADGGTLPPDGERSSHRGDRRHRRVRRRPGARGVHPGTHRIAIYGRLGRTPRVVEAISANGRHVTGIVDRASRAYLVVLAPGEGLHELHVIGRRGYRTALDLPPGAEQCGYAATLFGPF